MKTARDIQLFIFLMILTVLVSCGGAPGQEQESSSGGGGGTTRDDFNPTISFDVETSVTAQEQSATTLTVTNASSTEGDIQGYTWRQQDSTGVELDINVDGNQMTFTSSNIREDTELRLILLVDDTAGNQIGRNITILLMADTVSIAPMPISYSQPPVIGESMDLDIYTEDKIGDVSWRVLSAPEDSALIGSTFTTKEITITPDLPGNYVFEVTAEADGTSLQTSFEVTPTTAIDTSKIRGETTQVDNGGDPLEIPIDERLNIVENQAWIASSELSEQQIRDLASSVIGPPPAEPTDDGPNVELLEYNAHLGLLVQFNENSGRALDILEEILLQPEIDSVAYRLFEGETAARAELIPNDGGAFDDLGANWHLEYIDATSAWDITTGNSNIAIGITDTGFTVEHIDITGRVSEMLTDRSSDHGTFAVGTIGALSNNGQGVTGINWESDLILAGASIQGIQGLFKNENVRVINNSWAIPGYLDSTFDPLDSVAVGLRDEFVNDMTRAYRRLAQNNIGRVFVWPAGNGISNGSGNANLTFGIDGRYHSPGLHYDDKGNLNKQKNVIFAAAVLPDNRLAYYSNYGASVDIAAPTSFQSTMSTDAYHTGTFADGEGGYAGTSASSAVTSGVASLVYALNPDFTGEQVKSILLESATQQVTERYVRPNSDMTETLANPIPIINANLALLAAQEEINRLVSARLVVANPFTQEVTVNVNVLDDAYEVSQIDWVLSTSPNGSDNWQAFSNSVTSSTSVTTSLDPTNRYFQFDLSIDLNNLESSNTTSANIQVNSVYNTIRLSTLETVDLDPVSGVSLSLDQLDSPSIAQTGVTDGNGEVTVYALPGSYKIRGQLNGFEDSATRFFVDGSKNLDLLLVVSPQEISNTGALSGFVRDALDNPIEDAIVRISGGTQTNGFFASSTTDENGYYFFTNVSKQDSGGSEILNFLVEASSDDFSSSVKNNVRVLAGEDSTENIIMLQPRPFNPIFTDNFENGIGDWVAEGFWNQYNFAANTVANQSVNSGNTSLAPDESGPQALLPSPIFGEIAWWYGQASTGSFIGVNISDQNVLDGGTSEEFNEGSLTSPIINLSSAGIPFVRFRTWWEIESVNPNSSGFDIMSIEISTDAGQSFTSVKRLNPFVDPNDDDRNHKGFSSAGFYRKPIWVIEELDLTEYVGQNDLVIRFNFETRDSLFNGFRGWIIDDLVVGDYAVTAAESTVKTEQTREFLKVHKQPQQYQKATLER